MTTQTDPRHTADAVDLLAARRPTATVLEEMWTPGRAERALAEVSSGRAAASGRAASGRLLAPGRHRWMALSGAAAAVAATAFAVSTLLTPAVLPAAAALDDLARTAGSGAARVLAPGQYLHVVAREVQDNHAAAGTVPELGDDSDRTLESWTGADGTTWRRDTEGGSVAYSRFDDTTPSLTSPTPELVASLPTVPDELAAYLRDHTSGSSSADEAVFVGVGDMLRSGLASPQLSRAAIEVLADLPGVRVSDETFAGRAAVRVDFVDESARPGVVASIHLDASTAAALGQSLEAPELTSTRTVVSQAVVASIPTDVAERAVDDGTRTKGSSTTSS